MNIPNLLTISRILLTPVALYLHGRGELYGALILLAICFLTDFFDGRLARKWGQVTPLGSLLDPVADKWVVLLCYGYLWHLDYVPWWYALLLYARNIGQLLAIPVLIWWLKRVFHVRPRWPAKWATALAFVLIPLLLLKQGLNDSILGISDWGLWVLVAFSAVLELQVLVTYLPRFLQIARLKHDTFE